MANGALSSLGIGSNGTLSYDVIDQLKERDMQNSVKPIERDIVDINEKQSSLATLKSEIAAFKDSAASLSDSVLFAQRDVKVSGDSVQADVNAGVDIQDMDIEVQQLAQKDVYQTDNSYSQTTSGVASGETTLELSVGSKTYDIDVDGTTTLDELKGKINEIAGEDVTASVLNTGGDNPYKLVIKGDETGVDNAITLNDTGGKMNTGFTNIQTAQDAEFKYNGVGITRGSNQVDDLITGVNLTLVKEDEAGEKTNISIEQDNSGLKEKMEGFVETYNSLSGQLDELTRYDPDSGESGPFQGESTINRLKNDLSSIFTYTSGDRESLQEYGLDLDKEGKVSFDGEEFDNAIREKDVADMKQFFVGSYEEIHGEERLVDGVFKQFDNMADEYTNFSNGSLKYYGEQLESEEKSLTKEREKAVERLDQRYETMASRFALYDNQISNMQNSFQALQQQIDQGSK